MFGIPYNKKVIYLFIIIFYAEGTTGSVLGRVVGRWQLCLGYEVPFLPYAGTWALNHRGDPQFSGRVEQPQGWGSGAKQGTPSHTF